MTPGGSRLTHCILVGSSSVDIVVTTLLTCSSVTSTYVYADEIMPSKTHELDNLSLTGTSGKTDEPLRKSRREDRFQLSLGPLQI